MKDWVDFGATQWLWYTWESSALTTRPLLHNYKESENFRLKIHFFKIVNKVNSNSTITYSPKYANLRLSDIFDKISFL